MEIMLKNKCCLYAIISIRFFSITICDLLIEFPSYKKHSLECSETPDLYRGRAVPKGQDA